MTAKEMFATLGWQQSETNNFITYSQNGMFISFCKEEPALLNDVYITGIFLMRAVFKQAEELGWTNVPPRAVPGPSFRGQTWVQCPTCGSSSDINSVDPVSARGVYDIYICPRCKKQFARKGGSQDQQ